MEENVVTMWEAMFATIPATAVGVTVLAIVIGSINKRIDDTNKRIGDLKNDVNKRIDDLRELFMMIFGDEIRKAKLKKTGSDK